MRPLLLYRVLAEGVPDRIRSMEAKRQPAVQRLFQCVELELSLSFQCEPKEVANQLQLTLEGI